MRNFIRAILMMFSCFFFIACSNEGDSNSEAKTDHVWKEQTETINKAKEVEGMLMDSAESMRSSIENQE